MSDTDILIIGAGGIGSNLVDLLTRSIVVDSVPDIDAAVFPRETSVDNCGKLFDYIRIRSQIDQLHSEMQGQLESLEQLMTHHPPYTALQSKQFLLNVCNELGDRVSIVDDNIRILGNSGTTYQIAIDSSQSSDWYTVYCETNHRLVPICIQNSATEGGEEIPAGDILVSLVLTLYHDQDSSRNIETLIPHLGRTSSPENISITLMDGDIVESRNLRHQRYLKEDVGEYKAQSLANGLSEQILKNSCNLTIHPISEYLTERTDISNFDLVVVAVDCEEPRQLVHENAKCWLDLRATGDGFVMWSSVDNIEVLNLFPKLPSGQSASCQHENAVETGNIQFGFALAAAHGAQWIVQWLRGASTPSGKMYSIHMGELPLPEITQELVE